MDLSIRGVPKLEQKFVVGVDPGNLSTTPAVRLISPCDMLIYTRLPSHYSLVLVVSRRSTAILPHVLFDDTGTYCSLAALTFVRRTEIRRRVFRGIAVKLQKIRLRELFIFWLVEWKYTET